MFTQATQTEPMIYPRKALDVYLRRVLNDLDHVDWQDYQEATLALDDIRDAIDSCMEYAQQAGADLDPDALKPVVEHLYGRLQSAEAAPLLHRPRAGERLHRELAIFCAEYFPPIEGIAPREIGFSRAGSTLIAR
ncbi:MAG: hypothetical protein JO142_10855 [Burkholderiales bacterium]|nr:hypothetical protein [Burkholderiales bacterium]